MESQKLLERLLTSPAARKAARELEAEQQAERETLFEQRALLVEETEKLAPLHRRRDQAMGRLKKCQAECTVFERAAGDIGRELHSATQRLARRRDEIERQIIATAPKEIDETIAALWRRLDDPTDRHDGFKSLHDRGLAIHAAIAQLHALKLTEDFDPRTPARLGSVAA